MELHLAKLGWGCAPPTTHTPKCPEGAVSLTGVEGPAAGGDLGLLSQLHSHLGFQRNPRVKALEYPSICPLWQRLETSRLREAIWPGAGLLHWVVMGLGCPQA